MGYEIPTEVNFPSWKEQFSVEVLKPANPIYTVLKGVVMSNAISLRRVKKKFDLFIVGVARRDIRLTDRLRGRFLRNVFITVNWGSRSPTHILRVHTPHPKLLKFLKQNILLYFI